MSNAPSEFLLLNRLLRLYPVKALRDEFQITGSSQADLIDEVLANNTASGITKFCFDSFNYTKQHVYIFDLDKSFTAHTFNDADFPYDVKQKAVTQNGGITFYCLPEIVYKVVLQDPYESGIITFYQPLKVTVEKKTLIIQFTILEKNPNSYFESGRYIHGKRLLDEATLKNNILIYFQKNYYTTVCDINRGVKHLWQSDEIDSKYVKFKKDKSTTTETMDEDETYKKNYPTEYADMMNRPLGKTIIKYLMDDGNLCENFSVDPGKGEISFSRYPISVNQVENVINKILSNN